MENVKTLLIVDDEVDICFILEKHKGLRSKYQRIEYVHSLNEAFAKVNQIRPDTIVLDNNLPDGFGIDYIHQLRHDRAVRIIIVSAMSIRQDALNAGADHFLEKPLALHKLVAVA